MGQYGNFGQYAGQMMNSNFYGNWDFPIWVFAFLPLLMIWGIVWKGLALWRAAHNENKAWFIVLLLVNTVGILEILYLFVFSKKKEAPAQQPQQPVASV